MALYEDRASMEARGVTTMDTLPAHVLFGDNAAEISTPTRPTDEPAHVRELRTRAGNEAGMADGFFADAHVISEDGEVLTNEEAEQKKVERYIRNGSFASSTIAASIEFYDLSLPTAHAAQNYWTNRRDTLLNERAAIQTELDDINQKNHDCRKAVDDADQVVADAEAAHAEDEATVQRLENTIESGNVALQTGGMLGSDDGKVYQVVATEEGAMAISENEDGTFTMRPYEDAALIKDPSVIREVVYYSEMGLPHATQKGVLSAEEVAQAREAHAYNVKNMEETYNATLPLATEKKERLDEIDDELAETNNNLDLLSRYNDPDFRKRLEDGTETIPPEIHKILNDRRIRDGLDPLPAPGDDVAAKIEGESLWDSIWNTASSSIQSLTDTITGYEEEKETLKTDLLQIQENQKYLSDRIEWLKESANRAADGTLSMDEVEQATYAYDPGYWNDFHDRHPQSTPTNMSTANSTIFQSGGVKQSVRSMSTAQGVFNEDGIFVPNDPYGIDANIPASRAPMSMASTDGQGINTSVNPQNAFSNAASGQVNQSTISPEKLAELREDLGVDTQTPRVAQNSTSALAL